MSLKQPRISLIAAMADDRATNPVIKPPKIKAKIRVLS